MGGVGAVALLYVAASLTGILPRNRLKDAAVDVAEGVVILFTTWYVSIPLLLAFMLAGGRLVYVKGLRDAERMDVQADEMQEREREERHDREG